MQSRLILNEMWRKHVATLKRRAGAAEKEWLFRIYAAECMAVYISDTGYGFSFYNELSADVRHSDSV